MLTMLPKIVLFMRQCGNRQSKDDNIIQRMRFACWITGDTLGTCNIYFFFHGNNGYTNAPHCYVNGTLYDLLLSVQVLQIIT